jgi:signal transduction histidine kinase
VEAGIFESHKEDFDLNDVVIEAVSSLKKEASDKGLELKIGIMHIRMQTDRRRLLQCLLNLISNAVKFTEQGSVQVTVIQPSPPLTLSGGREGLMAGEGDLVEISVEDTGIGIAGEDVSMLFKPFVRLETPLKITVPGTGLGLYLTKKLVTEVLRGEILYERGSAEGSRFSMRIPVKI